MAIVMSLNSSISDLSGERAFADVCPGSNGYLWGDAEYSVGDDNEEVDGRTVWDNNLSNGFDTTATNVQITASADGTSLDVGDNDEVTSTDATTGSGIGEVDLRACTQSDGADAKWSNIVVKFYSGSTLTQTVNVGTLEATGTTSAPTQEDLAQITPASSNNDSVVITGTVELSTTEANVAPASSALFCQALIR